MISCKVTSTCDILHILEESIIFQYFFYHGRWAVSASCFALGVFLILPLPGCNKTHISIKKPTADNSIGECVILLHGLARTYHAMDSMQETLTEAGYHTVNLGYPSTEKGIATLAKEHFPEAIAMCRQFSPKAIHFVTHSLGGIVLRKGLVENRPRLLGKVVMLSPPNCGSAVTDKLQDWWFYEWLNGPAGQELHTGSDSMPNRLGPVTYPVGVITGDRYAFFDVWFSHILPGKNDGKVSVESAKVDGMNDFLVVHESHPFIMNSRYVQAETLYFLRHGVFKHEKRPLSPISGGDWFFSK